MKVADQKTILPHLRRTVDAIEEILHSGLTTASETTTQALGVTFQEASRMKLLRLGSTLRNTHQEITRYVENDDSFSQSRLVFFLNRSWLLCKGMEAAIQRSDSKQLDQLLWTAGTKKKKSLTLVCLGIVKKVSANNFCAFEFRLRDPKKNTPYTWSCVFPLRKNTQVPAEGFLHLPQKQKFAPSILVEGKLIEFKNFSITESETGATRIRLEEKSTVNVTQPFENWQSLIAWDTQAAIKRIKDHSTSPFDVDVELQEEVWLNEYSISESRTTAEPPRQIWPIACGQLKFAATLTNSKDSQPAATAIRKEAKQKKPNRPMFGLVHYSVGELVMQPLSIFIEKENRLDYISLSKDSINKAALLSALKFT